MADGAGAGGDELVRRLRLAIGRASDDWMIGLAGRGWNLQPLRYGGARGGRFESRGKHSTRNIQRPKPSSAGLALGGMRVV